MKFNRPAFAGLAVLIVAGVVLGVAVSGGSAKISRPPIAAGSAVRVKHTALGQTITAANGRTLYLFRGDKPGVSTVSPAGLAVWPAFTSSVTPHVQGGASAGLVGTIARSGGSRQVTYRGHPLYYYVGDQKPGDTRGQGLNQFGALWYVVSPGGNAVTSAPRTAAHHSTRPSLGHSSGY